MKKLLAFLLIIVFVIVIVAAILHKLVGSPTPSQPATNTPTTFPTVNSNVTASDPTASRAFLGQIQNANQITLQGNVVVGNYALQEWSDTNKGGQALLENNSNGWQLVSMGGGAWDVPSLEAVGVPGNIAAQLIAADARASQSAQ